METGRWEGLAREARHCELCGGADVEDAHALFHCSAYDDLRADYGQLFGAEDPPEVADLLQQGRALVAAFESASSYGGTAWAVALRSEQLAACDG